MSYQKGDLVEVNAGGALGWIPGVYSSPLGLSMHGVDISHPAIGAPGTLRFYDSEIRPALAVTVLEEWHLPEPTPPAKCDCGGHKLRHPSHSDWCSLIGNSTPFDQKKYIQQI